MDNAGYSYYISDGGGYTFDEAEVFCQNRDAELASITSDSEYRFLSEEMTRYEADVGITA